MEDEMDGAYAKHNREEKFIQNLGRKT